MARGGGTAGVGGEWDLLFGDEATAQAKAQALAQALKGQQADAYALQALTGGPRAAPQIAQGIGQAAQTEQAGLGQAAGQRLTAEIQRRHLAQQAAAQQASMAQHSASLAETQRQHSETIRHNRATEGINAQMLGGGGLSPEALDMLAQQTAQTGQIPNLGMGRAGAGQKIGIVNRAAELSPGANLAGNRAGYKADSSSLAKLQTQADAVNAFERTAMANLDQFLNASKGVVDTGSPLFNLPARKFAQQVAGDPKMTQFNVARQVAVQEIGKVLGGATGSAAISDSARHEVESLLSPDASLAQIHAAADILRRDMHNRRASYEAEIAHVRGRSGGGTAAPESAPSADLRKKYGL